MTCKVCEFRNRKILQHKRKQEALYDALKKGILSGMVIEIYRRDDYTGHISPTEQHPKSQEIIYRG